jgi:hypothetical protein
MRETMKCECVRGNAYVSTERTKPMRTTTRGRRRGSRRRGKGRRRGERKGEKSGEPVGNFLIHNGGGKRARRHTTGTCLREKEREREKRG